MLLYKTTCTDNFGKLFTRYQGSQTESSKARTALKKDGYKPETQTIEVPTNKSGLLEWLNANAA
ncbi:MAG: hypothetical protein WCG50_09345 [Rhodoferax sp.]|uniref:hypothetical protein n=1 Tax=Rhodoferax sp. TaxID=50421 RepID=UPI0030184DDE